jgi:Fe-S-cluster containining protein
MPTPKVHIARNQNYGCILCGRCCRRFQVRITDAEVTRLQALDWGSEVAVPQDFAHHIRGHSYFRRRSDGGCVFLDGESGACRMHARFGFAVKALTCRGYPHNVASTWRDEVSVVARLDCPAVQQHAGKPLEANRRQIERLVEELGTRGGFTVRQLEGLSREAVERLTRALVGLIEDHGSRTSPGALAYALFLAAERCRGLGASFLNDSATMETVLPSLLGGIRDDASARPAGRVGPLSKALFREWLAACCRRDEELVRPGLAVRLRRCAALGAYAFGVGSLRVMGQEHPDLSLRRAGLFAAGEGWEPSSPAAWEAFRRLLVARLEGPQFFGVAYYGEAFFTGLRALLQSYALVLAAARLHAAARVADSLASGSPGDAPGLRRGGGGPPHLHRQTSEGRLASGATAAPQRLEAEDVHYAVGAIDHSLGRSPLLQWKPWRHVEEYFCGARYGRLLNSLGWE